MNIFRLLYNFYKNLTRESNEVQYVSQVNLDDLHNKDESTLSTHIENQSVRQVLDWAVQKIELLHESDRHRNARAIAAEFDEWINIPEGTEELNYLCLENQEWTGDQEIDVR